MSLPYCHYLGRQTAIAYITQLNTARNIQTKKPSVSFSVAMRSLPSLFIEVTPIFFNLESVFIGVFFLLFREQSRQLVRCAPGSSQSEHA